MYSRNLAVIFAAVLIWVSGCGRKTHQTGPVTHLTGRAVLPADTIIPGPPVGKTLEPVINGRRLPLPGIPIQGFSSALRLPDNQFLVLQDNGFGTRANSPDVPLQWFRLTIELAEKQGAPGLVSLDDRTLITDPHNYLPETLPQGRLTGALLDPESFVRLNDGSFWIGEEFGPALIHVDERGQVLGPAVDIPIVPELKAYGRDRSILMTPDHPDLRHLAEAEQLANLPRSGGIEGLALSPNGRWIYASVEKAMLEDPLLTRRTILQFDPKSGSFTGEYRLYQVDAPDVSIASLESVDDHTLLVLERDGGEGTQAQIKRIYQVDWTDQSLSKTLVCDLMHIHDDGGLTTTEEGAIGLGEEYSFPYVTPECLLILDRQTLLVINDNNYPMSSGRRPPNTPDDNEFIRLRLEHPLVP